MNLEKAIEEQSWRKPRVGHKPKLMRPKHLSGNRTLFEILATVVVLFWLFRSQAQPGAVDPRYYANIDGAVRSFALQTDGKLIVGGDFQSVGGLGRVGVARLNSDGGPDVDFNTGFTWGFAQKVLIQPDGKIVVAGDFQQGTNYFPGLVRLLPDGATDPGFHPDPSIGQWKQAMASQPDGKLLIVSDNGVYRLLQDGSRDTGFNFLSGDQYKTNQDGSIIYFPINFSVLTILPEGKILVGGSSVGVLGRPVAGVIRLNTNGTIDNSFQPPTNWIAECLAVLPDGRILSGGSAEQGPEVVELFAAAGPIDPTFLNATTFSGQIQALAVEPDGRILVAGQFDGVNGLPRRNLARLNTDGTLDRGFDSSVSARIDALTIQTNGAILVGGWFDRHVMRVLSGEASFPGWFEFTSPLYQVDEGAGNVVVPVCRYGGTTGAVTVHYEAQSGSATAWSDFIPQSGALSFAPGQTSNYFVVPILDDSIPEGYPNDERIGLILSEPSGGASLGNLNSAVISIVDNDCELAFGARVFTGLEAAGEVAISIVRSGYPGTTVSVTCITSNGTAIGGRDYVSATNVVTLLSGETNKALSLTLVRDNKAEGEERFAVSLSDAQGATLGSTSNAVVRIVDDAPGAPDPEFVASAGYAPAFAVEAGGSFLAIPFNVVRCLANGRLDSTFHPPPDPIYYYRALAVQQDEKILLSNTSGSPGLVRLNSDGSLDSGFAFTSPDCTAPDIIRIQTDGKLLIAGHIYFRGMSRLNLDGSIDPSFNAGPLMRSPVSAMLVQPDNKILCFGRIETNGDVHPALVRLNSDGALDPEFNAQQFLDDDSVSQVALQTDGKVLAAGRFTLPDGGMRYAILRFLPDGRKDSDFLVTNAWPEIHGLVVQPGGKILVGTGIPGLVVRLNPNGTTDPTFDTGLGATDAGGVGSIGALGLQPDGGLLVSGGFSQMNGVDCPGLARLQNDSQSAPGEISLVLQTNALSETGEFVLAVTRTGGSNGVVVVPFSTVDGTAKEGADYVAQRGILTFADGDTTAKTIAIPIIADALPEGDETFQVYLGTPVGGAVWGKSTSLALTITDDDVTLQFAEGQFRVYEQGVSQTLVVQRLGQISTAVTVDYATMDGTAHAGFDYFAQQGTLRFLPGETNKLIQVPIIDDPIAEPDETFTVVLSNPSTGAMLGAVSSATVTVVDDDHSGMLDPTFDTGSGFCDSSIYGSSGLYAIALQHDGRLLVGGDFQFYSGQPCDGLLRFLPDGTIDSGFSASSDWGMERPAVRQIGLQADGKAVIATRLVYNPDSYVRLLTNGLPDPTFGPVRLNSSIAAQSNGRILALHVLDDDRIVIAGAFKTVNSVERYNVARLNPDGSLDSSFVPPLGSATAWAESITCMAVDANGKVLVGGIFTVTNTVPSFGLARLNTNGSLDSSFDPGTGLADASGISSYFSGIAPNALAVQPDGCILVGGSFMQINGTMRTNIARLKPDGTVDQEFKAAVGWGDMPGLASVWTIALQPDKKILIGGLFGDLNGEPRYGLGRLNVDGSLDATFTSGDPNFGIPTIRAIEPDAQRGILVAGSFSGIAGVRRCNLARIRTSGSLTPDGRSWLTSLNRDVTGNVKLCFVAAPGLHYGVEASSDLNLWIPLGTATELSDGCFEFEDPTTGPQIRFYRVISP